jgi:hypothetical protein
MDLEQRVSNLERNGSEIQPGNVAYVNRGPILVSTTYNPGDIAIYNGQRILFKNTVTTGSSGNPPFVSSTNYVPLGSATQYFASDYGVVGDGNTASAGANTTKLNDLIVQASGKGGGQVYLPEGIVYVNDTILLRNGVHLYGQGFVLSQLKLAPNSDCDVVATYESSNGIEGNAFYCGIWNLEIHGNRDNQTAGTFAHGINVTTNPTSTKATNDLGFDPFHIFQNVYIVECSGHGYYHSGRSGVRLIGVWSKSNNGRGFHLSFDTEVVACHAEANGLSGFYMPSSNTTLSACKSYNNGRLKNALTGGTPPTGSAWSSSTSYVLGNLVSYSGTTFICTTANSNKAPVFNSTVERRLTTASYWWQAIAPGSYAYWYPSQTYAARDVVLWDNNLYIAKNSVTSNTVPASDSTNWANVCAAKDYGVGFFMGNQAVSGTLGNTRSIVGCISQTNATDSYVAYCIAAPQIIGTSNDTPGVNGDQTYDTTNFNQYAVLNVVGSTAGNIYVSGAQGNNSAYGFRLVNSGSLNSTENNIFGGFDSTYKNPPRTTDTFGLTYAASSYNYVVVNGSMASDLSTDRALRVKNSFYGGISQETRYVGALTTGMPTGSASFQVGDMVIDTSGNILVCNSSSGSTQTWLPVGGFRGTATLVAGTVTVSNAYVTSNSRIMLTIQESGGTIGTPYISAKTAGTSFVITSTSGTDTSKIGWVLYPNG